MGAESTSASGGVIECMAEGALHLQMVERTKVIMLTDLKAGKALSPGQMAAAMRARGKLVNNMALESGKVLIPCPDVANGRLVNESGGSQMTEVQLRKKLIHRLVCMTRVESRVSLFFICCSRNGD